MYFTTRTMVNLVYDQQRQIVVDRNRFRKLIPIRFCKNPWGDSTAMATEGFKKIGK